MGTILLCGIIGYLIGAAVAWYVCRPMKAFNDGFNDGYEHAKKFYGDWGRGFNEGWDSGWETAFKKVDEALFTPIEKSKEEKDERNDDEIGRQENAHSSER